MLAQSIYAENRDKVKASKALDTAIKNEKKEQDIT